MDTHKDKKDAREAVFGLFNERYELEKAVDSLKTAGFRNYDISVLFGESAGGAKMAHENATKAPEGASTGAVAGVALGGALGWLVGIGSLAIPGVGPFIAAGPILAAIAGAGMAGTLGGITGGLVGLGIPEYEAKRYESLIREGGYLLSVHVDDSDWKKKATTILAQAGGESVSTKGEKAPPKVSPPKPRGPDLNTPRFN